MKKINSVELAQQAFNLATSNGCREMTFERFLDALKYLSELKKK